MGNLDWTRDELILALDLYTRVDVGSVPKHDPEIVAVSDVLKGLPIHPVEKREANFRSPDAVYMKLGNFRRIDPSYGGKGLDAGNKLELPVWDDFHGDIDTLRTIAAVIRESPLTLGQAPAPTDGEDDGAGRPEGELVLRVHKCRERDGTVPRKKKEAVLAATGRLDCEVCGFDFSEHYGELGTGFAECHHRRPLSELTASRRTTQKDLAIVCANCHRMLHRAKPWLTVEELRLRL